MCSADVILRQYKLEVMGNESGDSRCPQVITIAHNYACLVTCRKYESGQLKRLPGLLIAWKKAIQLIDGGSSIRNAAKVMGIPFSSLQKRVKKGSTLGPHLGRFTVFSPEADAELANLVKKMANIFYGCTANQIRSGFRIC
ncbi:hypothetical protein NQ318_009102 [Aromia moschata]|uniref:HTH psq-type domain-containing protein n=1 Tax=Aromia moschata TaxID=1265417 RepID=A0AAV8XP83_9CUCU|nr:hypothetical protein NQ318_009102 [Aromia moschata]